MSELTFAPAEQTKFSDLQTTGRIVRVQTGTTELMCHVLIIEDEPVFAEVLRCLLEDEGAETFDYADTEDAAVAAALRHSPDIITSDVKLLSGTGPQAVSAIHERLGDIPVIFITATPADCEPCNPPGRILRKPIDCDELAEAFHELAGA